MSVGTQVKVIALVLISHYVYVPLCCSDRMTAEECLLHPWIKVTTNLLQFLRPALIVYCITLKFYCDVVFISPSHANRWPIGIDLQSIWRILRSSMPEGNGRWVKICMQNQHFYLLKRWQEMKEKKDNKTDERQEASKIRSWTPLSYFRWTSVKLKIQITPQIFPKKFLFFFSSCFHTYVCSSLYFSHQLGFN